MSNPIKGFRVAVANWFRGLARSWESAPRTYRSRPRFQLESLEGRVVPATGLFGPGILSTLPDARIEFSPDYTHLGGGGKSVEAYNNAAGSLQITPMLTGGVLAEVDSTHAVIYSPDGTRLGGGGTSQQVYDGAKGAATLVPLYSGKGVLVEFARDNTVFYSPDYLHLSGGGKTQEVYDGKSGAVNLFALGNGGVLTEVVSSHAVFLSKDDTHLTGGGSTQQVYDGKSGAVELVRTFGNGVLTRVLGSNKVFYSPDFTNLTDTTTKGTKTQEVYDGSLGAVNLVTLHHDHGVLVQVASSHKVFYSPDYTHLISGGKTTLVYDGSQGAVNLFPAGDGGVLVQVQSSNHVFYSTDGTHLVGGGNTVEVYTGVSGAVELHPLNGGGVLTVQASSHAAFVSPDFMNLLGGGNTKEAYDGGAGGLSYVSLIKLQASDLKVTTTPVTSRMDGKTANLQIEDVIPGTGTGVATNGKTLTVQYTGWLDDGTRFDSSFIAHGTQGPQPFTFTLGAQQVIQGWDAGLVGMQVGGVRKLIIPANLAYGSTARSGIPANSQLTFEIELISVH